MTSFIIRYTSYLAPTTSMRLHSEAQAQSYHPSNPLEGPSGKPCGNLRAMETPYVVRSHAAAQTHKELCCWDFSHPVQRGNKHCENNTSITTACDGINNERHVELNFTEDISFAAGFKCGYGSKDKGIEKIVSSINNDSTLRNSHSYTLHGLLGTFHCLLYKTSKEKPINISIAPNSFSNGMYSWFPLYFPLREPIIVPEGCSIRCNIWRKTDAKNPSQIGGSVWYEWHVEILDGNSSVINCSNLHNPGGRSSKILL